MKNIFKFAIILVFVFALSSIYVTASHDPSDINACFCKPGLWFDFGPGPKDCKGANVCASGYTPLYDCPFAVLEPGINECISGTCACNGCSNLEGEQCHSGCCSGLSCSNGHCCPSGEDWDGDSCEPPQVCTPDTWQNTGSSCGNCGTEQRYCDSLGQWTNSYQCFNPGPCSPGQTNWDGGCGNCGTWRQDCQGNCQWSGWYCGGGSCAFGK